MKVSTLRVSLAINAVLAGVVLVLGAHTLSARGGVGVDAGRTVSWPAVGPQVRANVTALKALNEKLLACGFTEPQARQLVLTSLPQPPVSAFEYWRPALARQLSDRVAEYDARQVQRAALIEAFGSSAADQPEFAEVFFPFADRWSYLSKSEQAALEAKLVEQQRGRLAALQGPAPQRPGAQLDVENILGIEAAREYQRRESLLAQSLSNIGFDFSEREFRSVVEILSDADGGEVNAIAARLNPMRMSNDQDPVTAQIKEALGQVRFNEYRKRQDPKYRVLLAAGEMYAIAPATVDKAYEIDAANDSKIAQLMKQGPVLSADARRVIEDLRAAQSKQLRELLGEEASAFYTRSTAAMGGALATAPMGAPIMVRQRSN